MYRLPAFAAAAVSVQDCFIKAENPEVPRHTEALPRLQMCRLCHAQRAQAFRQEGRSRAGARRGYRDYSSFCLITVSLAGRSFRRARKTLGDAHPAGGGLA